MAQIDDHMAAVSLGAFPTPTPTGSQRAAFGVSFGLLGTLPTVILVGIEYVRGWDQIKIDAWDMDGPWDDEQ